MPESKTRIPEDDFVSKVVKDPKQPPDTLLLSGFLGKSSEDGHIRLYFDPELKSYVEIPQEAIQHWQEIPKEVSPLGGYHVWINPNAELVHGKVGPQRTKAKFLEGPIAAAAAGMGAVGAQPAIGNSQFCITSAELCQHTIHPRCLPVYRTAGFPCLNVAVDPNRIPIGLPTQQCATPACTVGIACTPPGFTVIGCFGPEAAMNAPVAPQAVKAPLPSARPVCPPTFVVHCPTLQIHCPSQGCLSAHCPSPDCGSVICGTGIDCPSAPIFCTYFDCFAGAAQPAAVAATAAANCITHACPTLRFHCPSLGCPVTAPCPSAVCTLDLVGCGVVRNTIHPCIGFDVAGAGAAQAAAPQAASVACVTHPLCQTQFQHCPTFACPATMTCQTIGCATSGANCATGFPCIG